MRIRLFPLQDNPFVRSRLFFLTEIKMIEWLEV